MSTVINLIGFDWASESVVSEIRRNLTALISTPAGTCAGDRYYGIDQSCLDAPTGAAANLLTLEIIEKIAIYEPRVELSKTSVTPTEGGVKVELTFSAAD